ncbi:MAG: glycosyltransferase, partial [Acidimicrobiia bacterium]
MMGHAASTGFDERGDTGRILEYGDDAASWCEPDDVRSLADAIVAVLEDPTRVAALVEAGRRRVAHHTWDATAAGL